MREDTNLCAALRLGYMYDIGLGVTRNYLEPFKWWEKAAKQGQA